MSSHKYMTYKKTVLEDGIRVVTEEVPIAISTALGIWIEAGSRDESEPENGLAHLIEHMAFKGTTLRSKLDIARQIDRQGGQANAFTTKEYTCFHTRVRPEQLPEAVDLLVDIFQNSLYEEEDLELEKQVILQEIAMGDDEPETYAHDLAATFFWPGHSLGRPVAGTSEVVSALDRKAITAWLEKHYTGGRIIVSAAGAVDHQQLVELLMTRLAHRPQGAARQMTRPEFQPGLVIKPRSLEQAHMVMATSFPDTADKRRHAASVLSAALGGNMSSRLFQAIRVNWGLVYTVYSYYNAYHGTGSLEIYAAAAPDRIAETRSLVKAELKKMRLELMPCEELAEAVDGLKTSIVLSADSMDGRMSRLAVDEMYYGRRVEPEETCAELDAVKAGDVLELAEEFFREENFLTCVVGPVEEDLF